jgi:hypothetical protein
MKKGLRQCLSGGGSLGEQFHRSLGNSFEPVKRKEEGFSAWLCWLFRNLEFPFTLLDFLVIYPFAKYHTIVTCKGMIIVGQYHTSSISRQKVHLAAS